MRRTRACMHTHRDAHDDDDDQKPEESVAASSSFGPPLRFEKEPRAAMQDMREVGGNNAEEGVLHGCSTPEPPCCPLPPSFHVVRSGDRPLRGLGVAAGAGPNPPGRLWRGGPGMCVQTDSGSDSIGGDERRRLTGPCPASCRPVHPSRVSVCPYAHPPQWSCASQTAGRCTPAWGGGAGICGRLTSSGGCGWLSRGRRTRDGWREGCLCVWVWVCGCARRGSRGSKHDPTPACSIQSNTAREELAAKGGWQVKGYPLCLDPSAATYI